MQTILVTGYENPDLDGVACMIAYAEFLNARGKHAVPAIIGKPSSEAQYVLSFLCIPDLPDISAIQYSSIVLVDASETYVLQGMIDLAKVIEVIDHRKTNDAYNFVNAKVQIELVGSAATLVAERLHTAGFHPSKNAATLLYTAIVSNTVNFQANVTTARDKTMAAWLKPQASLPETFVHDMFVFKSQFSVSLKQVLFDDLAIAVFAGKRVGICQLEIVNLQEFMQKNKQELLQALRDVSVEENLPYNVLTCIDVEKAHNMFMTADAASQQLLEKALNITIKDNTAIRQGVLMRKEIGPKMKDVLERLNELK